MINANAITNGNGGQVAVWSENYTNMLGNISATGGASGGNGGYIETSSHGVLDVGNVQINTSAPAGNEGTWLLDPNSITIGTTDNGDYTTSGTNPFTYTANNTTSNLLYSTVNSELSTNNVAVVASGTITLAASSPLSWSTGNYLLLNAGSTISLGSTIATGTSASYLELESPSAISQTAAISGSGGVTVTGGGTFTLAAANTYTGPTLIEGGSAVSIPSSSDISSSSIITFGTGNGTLDTTATMTLSNQISVASGGVTGIIAPSSSTTLTLSGAISSADNLGTLEINGGALSGIISLGAGSGTFTDAFDLNAGTVELTAASNVTLSGANSFTIATGALLNLNLGAYNETINNLSGGGNIELYSATSNTLTVNQTTAGTYSGVISGTSANDDFILGASSTNTLTLTNSNTYGGTTTIDAGVLAADNGTTGTLSTGAITVDSGGTLQIDANTNLGNAITLNGAGASGTSGALWGSGSGASGSTGTITLGATGTDTIGANTGNTLSVGTITGSYALDTSGLGTVALTSSSSSFTGNLDVLEGTVTAASLPTTSGNSTIGTGILEVGGASTSGDFDYTGGNVSFPRYLEVNYGGGEFDIPSGVKVTLITDGIEAISDIGTLSLGGGGTLNLAAAVSSYGPVNILSTNTFQAGVVNAIYEENINVGPSATLDLQTYSNVVGTLTGTGTVDVGSGAVLSTYSSSNFTWGGVIQGLGGLTKAIDTGEMTLTNDNTYSGTTTVSDGTLSLGVNNALSGSTAFSITSGGTLDLSYSGATSSTIGHNTPNISIARYRHRHCRCTDLHRQR